MPAGRRLIELAALLLIGATPIGGVWIFGALIPQAMVPLMVAALGGCALYWLRYALFTRLPAPALPPGFLWALLFLLYAVLSISWADTPRVAVFEVLKFTTYVFVYQAWAGLSGENGRWRFILGLFLLSVTLMGWYAIVQHANGSRLVLNVPRPEQYEMRASGTYICPNHFANLLAMTVCLAVALVGMRSAGIPLRLIAAYSIAVLLPPLYLSGSRSAWLGLAAGLSATIATLGLRKGPGRALVLLIVVPILCAAVGAVIWWFSPLVQERVADALKGNVRIQLWRDTLAMIAARPWFGFGAGMYKWVHPEHWRHLQMHIDPEHAHNDFLELIAEFGLVGAVLLLGALGIALFRLLWLVRFGEADRGDFLIAGFTGACAASSIHALFDYNFRLFGNVHVLALIGGVAAGVLYQGGHLRSPSVLLNWRGSDRWYAGAALLPVALVPLVLKIGVSDILVERGDKLRKRGLRGEAVEIYKKAAAVDSSNFEAHREIGFVYAGMAMWNLDRETKAEQINEALARFDRALALNPRDLASLFGKAKVLHLAGRDEEALSLFQRLVEAAPYDREYWVALGLQLRNMRRYRESLDAFLKARSLGTTEQIELAIGMLQRRLSREEQKSQ